MMSMMPPSLDFSERDTYEESSPLLTPPATSLEQAERPKKTSKHWISLCVYLFFLVAAIDFGSYIAEPPKTRVFEANLCLRYYEKHDPSKINKDGTVDESLCKITPVQDKLAAIIGWADLFEVIPGILLAVPYGTLADKYGRKWILSLSMLGLFLDSAWIVLICYFRNLPLQLIWLGAVFLIVGGGPVVATALAVTVASDIVPPERRTTIFLYLTVSTLVAEFFAPIAAAALMKNGSWLALSVSLVVLGLTVTLTPFIPETLRYHNLPEPSEDEEIDPVELQTASKPNGYGLQAQLAHLRDAVHYLRRDYTLALVVFSFLANRLGRQSLTLLIRYASQRYGWPIRQASYLLSVRAAASFVALIVVIPTINLALLKKLRLSAHQADLIVARGSIIITAISMLIMGFSATPSLLVLGLLVYNLGTGYGAAMRSISIAAAGGQSSPDIGRLMSLIAIMEGFGGMLAGPLLNSCFRWGMQLGRAFLGLPFVFSATIFALVSIITFKISVHRLNFAEGVEESGQTHTETEVCGHHD